MLLLVSGAAGAAECRDNNSKWQPCRLQMDEPGSRWQVSMQGRRWQFSHDGSGVVQMREGDAPWQSVRPRWSGSGALCWGDLCARGELPLD